MSERPASTNTARSREDYFRGKRAVFVTWNPNCSRSANQSRLLGAELVIVSIGRKLPTIVGTAIRYLLSFVATLGALSARKPGVLFTENMPVFLVLAVSLYARLARVPFIIDCHSGPFNNPKWQWARPLYKRLSRQALVNMNTNDTHKAIVEAWGGRSLIVADIPIEVDTIEAPTDAVRPYVAVVASYAFDEPIAEIFELARQFESCNFLLTGNYMKLETGLRETAPPNLRFTGFLSYPQYLGVLSHAEAVMVLTTRDNTMQRGAYEALALEMPIITSDFDILRNSFGEAAVYVDNSAESLVRAVARVLNDRHALRVAAKNQRLVRARTYFEAADQIASMVVATDG